MVNRANGKRCARLAVLAAAAMVFVNAPAASAQTTNPSTTAPATTAAAEHGIIPIPVYTGGLFERAHLAGDFGGLRTDLARKGFQLNVDWVQTVQSVVDGGRDTSTKYGGSLDYLFTADLDRMGLMPGGFFKVRAETRYGESVNTTSGAILPVSTDGFFPLTSPADDTIPITVTDLAYYQYLSPKFALVAGKLDTLDGDPNEFASGRGNTQFMNSQFVFSSTMSLMPYSTIGGGVIVMPTKDVTITSLVVSLNDSSTTSGLDALDEGWAWSSEAEFQYRLGKLPGGSNVGAVYLWDTSFFDFSGRFTFSPAEGIVAPTQSDTWIAYVSGWQYVIVNNPTEDGPLDVGNGQPDLEGFGLFWRGAIADDDVNPTKWTVSGGVGGKGMIPAREHDFYGVGYYYNNVQTTRLTSAAGLQDHTQGFECFYNIALTPAAQLTLDAQLIDSAQSGLDTGVILGMRLKLEL